MSSLFIIIEGIDGLGKSTLSQSLAEVLDAKLVQMPGPLRAHLNNPDIPREDHLALFTADRLITYHEVILPALNEGRHVVCDRYSLSTYAYQSAVHGGEQVLKGLKYPADILLYLQGPLELSASRRESRGNSSSALEEYEKKLADTKARYDHAVQTKSSYFAKEIEVINAEQTKAEMLKHAVQTFIDVAKLHGDFDFEQVQQKLAEVCARG